ncbi:HD domain-containing protein [Salsuginibacillus halophilus]|uniref:HD domain-containing protein n=1 Tax=Salsuginibacillus halophilus TaxID=517424 RepID=A0A2P8HXB3_9BACI|nr:HD domain-containing phosphohydrolase [Salsuginibacillus halophilus]PSL50869.1 HD domain-containing protein [Salsuginibacillus halophilus]
MRYKLLHQVDQGDELARHIYASDGRVLLQEGVPLTVGLIAKLRHMGVWAVYIKDDTFGEVQVEEMVSETTRRETLGTLSACHAQIQKGGEVEIQDVQKSVTKLIEEILENKDLLLALTDIKTEANEIFVHSLNVCMTSILIGVKMNLNREKLQELAIGALMHDVGKVTGKVDRTKKDRMQPEHHTWLGFDILRVNHEISTLSAHVALAHHEYLDGSGVPRKLEGNDIHALARITTVANDFDNLLTKGDGEKPMLPHEACENIMGATNLKYAHPIVWRFLRAVAFYPNGSQVRLTTGQTGVVIAQHKGLPQRPVVRAFNIVGHAKEDYEFVDIDLAEERTVFIKEVL